MADFRTGLTLAPRMRQEMKVNPRLYQAMDLLYMPLLDLQQHLKQELENNPFLDLVEPEEELKEEEEEEEESAEEPEDEIDWEEILLNGFDVGGRRAEYEEREFYRPTPASVRDLWDYLRDQLQLLRLSSREFLLGEEIIGNISREGFLTCSLEEVVEALNAYLAELEADSAEGAEPYTLAEAERMLGMVQAFDPSGIGARDLRECLLLQLRDRGETESLAHRIVRDHFEELVNHRWSEKKYCKWQ